LFTCFAFLSLAWAGARRSMHAPFIRAMKWLYYKAIERARERKRKRNRGDETDQHWRRIYTTFRASLMVLDVFYSHHPFFLVYTAYSKKWGTFLDRGSVHCTYIYASIHMHYCSKKIRFELLPSIYIVTIPYHRHLVSFTTFNSHQERNYQNKPPSEHFLHRLKRRRNANDPLRSTVKHIASYQSYASHGHSPRLEHLQSSARSVRRPAQPSPSIHSHSAHQYPASCAASRP
jgi:hypothetical protein